MTAFIVTDLGFGDAGKGTVVDWLCSRRKVALVVRHNGGAQAGHNVVTDDGRHHTFSQWGAGTFHGVPTYLGPHFVLHPGAAQVEAAVLRGKGVRDPWALVRVDYDALVITPYHQLLNRIREAARGAAAHGTCGIGIGETVGAALGGRPALTAHAARFVSPPALAEALRQIKRWAKSEAEPLLGDVPEEVRAAWVRDFDALTPEDVVESWGEWRARAILVRGHPLESSSDIIFEGAQGVLLDEWHGFHPHTTWSRTTDDNARALLGAARYEGLVVRVGVTRTYACRHGEGPLPTEGKMTSESREPHNRGDGAQGRFRTGAWDAVLTRYALDATGGCDVLAVTHLDSVLSNNPWAWSPYYHRDGDSARVYELQVRPRPEGELSRLMFQEEGAAFLRKCTAQISYAVPNEETVIGRIEEETGVPVGVVSYGPRATAKRTRAPFRAGVRG